MSEYSPREENFNIISHAIGIILSIIALFLLVGRATAFGDIRHIIGISIYGTSLILVYLASTLYHSATQPDVRFKLKIFDHSAIFGLLAGTYTPFCLVTLDGNIGKLVLGIVWGLALIGITLKLFFTGRYKILSTLMYLFMGWMILFAINPLVESLAYEGLCWLLAGGISYTIGAIFFSIERIKFNHAIFHVFVLAGSFCHFYSVFFYVLPGR